MELDPYDLIAEPQVLASLRDFFPFTSGSRYSIPYYFVSEGAVTSDFMSDNTPGSRAIAFSRHESRFIARVFRRLSKQIAIKPELAQDPVTGLKFASVSSIQSFSSAAGIVNSDFRWSQQPSLLPTSYLLVELDLDDSRSSRLTKFEKRLVVHEIGHVLGLEHLPGGPADPRYTDRDTIMSYNVGGKFCSTWYSTADLLALKRIWGKAPRLR